MRSQSDTRLEGYRVDILLVFDRHGAPPPIARHGILHPLNLRHNIT